MDNNSLQILDLIRESNERVGSSKRDVYSNEYRHDYDNDSSTDEEPIDEDFSSDEESDFISKYGNISTQTSNKGKVKIKFDGDGTEENVDGLSDDEFEAEMEKELQDRVKSAETAAALIEPSKSIPLPGEDENEGGDDDEDMGDIIQDSTSGKYSDIYFDSDEEDGENRKLKTNDELFYDPKQDDEDQSWVDDVRRSYHQSSTEKKPTIPTPGVAPLPSSDAVLNCPACFTVLCLDCQRHAVYKTQYRAMFVINCTVDTQQKLRFPVKGKGKNKKKKHLAALDPNEEFHPVHCDQCKTEVAMYDTDEVYHFFNVVASHT